jgi:hypothetical protein
MGTAVDGVMATETSGSNSAVVTTNGASCSIVLKETAVAEMVTALRPPVH